MFLDGVADPCSAISTGLGMDHMLSTNTVRGLGEGLDAYGLWHYDKSAWMSMSLLFKFQCDNTRNTEDPPVWRGQCPRPFRHSRVFFWPSCCASRCCHVFFACFCL